MFFEFSSQLNYLLLVILGFFSIASFILAVVTLTNAYRLRNVLMKWNSNSFYGVPLFASFFFVLSLVLSGIAWYYGMSGYYPVVAAYTFLSVNWLISSHYMSRRYITDNGIVKNINDPSQTVSWHEIQDFVEQSNETSNSYAFFYMLEHNETKPFQCFRLEIEVPSGRIQSFRKILNHKLGRRFQHTFSDEHAFGKINIRP